MSKVNFQAINPVPRYLLNKLDEKPKYVEKSRTITTEENYVPIRRHIYGIFD